MKIIKAILFLATLVVSTSANSALVSRLGGQAYYDDVADLTWLQPDFARNAAPNGLMNWADANNWAAGLNIDGITGWRLPGTPDRDTTCSYPQIGVGTGCTGSEMGNLYYNVLGLHINPNNTGPFFGLHNNSYRYWSSDETFVSHTPYPYAWTFRMTDGIQGREVQHGDWLTAWAVHDGDVALVSAVPVPAAVWLFGSGLLGLVAVSRRKVTT